jgi:hypothetical protein
MSEHGSFSGNPKTEWLVDPFGRDRDMRLIEDFWYQDPDGRKWTAPAGSIVNGASIPRPLWASVGSPYTDDYRRPSIVHDVACEGPEVERKDADVMFYHACRAAGCPPRQAIWLYAGVRLGAWCRSNLSEESISRDAMLFKVPLEVSAEAQYLQNDFEALATQLEGLPDDASTEEIDAVIEGRMKF